VLCIDNIGQDREYSEEELSLIVDTVVNVRNSWMKIEKDLLIKDRDIRLEMMKVEENYKITVIKLKYICVCMLIKYILFI